MVETNTSTDERYKPEVGEHKTHPRADDPEPNEYTVSFDDWQRDDITIACRNDTKGTFDSILEADVAVFRLEEPQQDLLAELLYVISKTEKSLFVIISNKLLYGTPFPHERPWESGAWEPSPVTPWDLARLPEKCRIAIDFLLDERTPLSAELVISEGVVTYSEMNLEVYPDHL